MDTINTKSVEAQLRMELGVAIESIKSSDNEDFLLTIKREKSLLPAIVGILKELPKEFLINKYANEIVISVYNNFMRHYFEVKINDDAMFVNAAVASIMRKELPKAVTAEDAIDALTGATLGVKALSSTAVELVLLISKEKGKQESEDSGL